ncbi:MAG TPA: hypothetical protein VFA43_01355 [Gemmatimonadaceae bacterium]|nr:hypothetical protein [Gemmatimonadaceae bacterium]
MSVRDTIFLAVFIGDPIALALLDVYLVRRGHTRAILWWSLAVCVASTVIWYFLYRGSDFGMDPQFDKPILHEHIWAPPFYFGVPAMVVGLIAAKTRKRFQWAAHVGVTALIGTVSLAPAYVLGLAALLTATGYRGF